MRRSSIVIAAVVGGIIASLGLGLYSHFRSSPNSHKVGDFDGAVRVTPAMLPLKVSENKRHLVDQKGVPFLVVGDTAWSLIAQLVRGEGCHVWDLDGDEYIEYGMGLRAVILGHGYRSVVEAAARQMPFGTNFVRPAPMEVECAERFLEMVPTADMVKFSKDGSDALDGAVRLSPAHTGRDYVAICGDHPFFSTSDWFIGATAMPGGTPTLHLMSLANRFSLGNLE